MFYMFRCVKNGYAGENHRHTHFLDSHNNSISEFSYCLS